MYREPEFLPWDGRIVPLTLLGGYLGVGKTTIINMMAGLEKPDEGVVRKGCRVSFPLGFMGGVVGPLCVGIVLDAAGGGTVLGWALAIAAMGAGSVAALAAILFVGGRKN